MQSNSVKILLLIGFIFTAPAAIAARKRCENNNAKSMISCMKKKRLINRYHIAKLKQFIKIDIQNKCLGTGKGSNTHRTFNCIDNNINVANKISAPKPPGNRLIRQRRITNN